MTLRILGRTHSSVMRAALSSVAALLFLLQMVGVGFAAGATADSAQFSGVVCATFKADSARASQNDSSPIESHHVGPCCILHCSSAIDGEEERVLIAILPLEMFSGAPTPLYVVDAVVAAPELRPLFPRAPPARLA